MARMIKTRLFAAVLDALLLVGGMALAQKPKENVSSVRQSPERTNFSRTGMITHPSYGPGVTLRLSE